MSRGRVLLLAFVVFLYISIRAENNKVILADINGEITEATSIEISDTTKKEPSGPSGKNADIDST